MKRLFFFFTALLSTAAASAQLGGNGYYRVQNFSSERYIIMVDNKTKGANVTGNDYDLNALRTKKPFSSIADDPCSIYYIESKGGNQYNLKAQGTDAYQVVGRYITVTKTTVINGVQTYYASGTVGGQTAKLADQQNTTKTLGSLVVNGQGTFNNWKILPVSATDDGNYFGVTPEFTVGGQRYTSLFASFPFTPYSSGVKTFIVTKIDDDMAVWQEVEGKIAASTPVIIAVPGATASDNRLSIELQDGTKPAGNLLKGLYFNNSDIYSEQNFHYNVTPYDPVTMRLLGVTSQGKLGFVKASVATVPRNRAYITVPAGSPDEITLVTQAEYEAAIAADRVTVTAKSYTRTYGDANPTFEYTVEGTLKGGAPAVSCSATAESPVGTYPIVVSKGGSTNRTFNGVNGTLTITKAPLTITARSYTIKQNEQLPVFEADITGFKLGQTDGVLKSKPVLSCTLPEGTFIPEGTYEITVSGAVADNYSMNYVPGKLTVIKADPITVTATNLSKVYGDAMPSLTWTVSGGSLKGTPQLKCEATEASVPGTYTITIEKGTLDDYPNLQFVGGTLTITKAALTASVADASRIYGDENPEFAVSYSGFRLSDDASSLTTPASAATEATVASSVGTYDIVVSGAESQCYDIAYKNGTLTVEKATLQASVGNYSREEGQPNPEFVILYEGFRNGDDESVLSVKPVATTVADETSAAGEYEIIVSGGEAQNYAFTYVAGRLVVQAYNGIATVIFAAPVDIYTIAGRLVRAGVTTTYGLPRGIYVVNGRKIVVR